MNPDSRALVERVDLIEPGDPVDGTQVNRRRQRGRRRIDLIRPPRTERRKIRRGPGCGLLAECARPRPYRRAALLRAPPPPLHVRGRCHRGAEPPRSATRQTAAARAPSQCQPEDPPRARRSPRQFAPPGRCRARSRSSPPTEWPARTPPPPARPAPFPRQTPPARAFHRPRASTPLRGAQDPRQSGDPLRYAGVVRICHDEIACHSCDTHQPPMRRIRPVGFTPPAGGDFSRS